MPPGEGCLPRPKGLGKRRGGLNSLLRHRNGLRNLATIDLVAKSEQLFLLHAFIAIDKLELGKADHGVAAIVLFLLFRITSS